MKLHDLTYKNSTSIRKTVKLSHKYRVAQKSKPLLNKQKFALKPNSEIRFFRQIKV